MSDGFDALSWSLNAKRFSSTSAGIAAAVVSQLSAVVETRV